jgi:hypothetical protein
LSGRTPGQTSLVAHPILPVRAATTTPVEPQVDFVLDPAAAAFPVVMAGRLPRWLFRGLLGVHCTLRPARSADSLKEPCPRVFQPICRLLSRPWCFRLGRTSPVGIQPEDPMCLRKAHTIT